MEKRIDEKKNLKKDKADKLSNFAAVLTQLRKERGISQKKAALDLGISQALLSHYEKGIRECGLDFVIKCGEYYGVTTDYLLGVSSNRNGVDTSYIDTPIDENGEISVGTLAQASTFLLDIISSAKDAQAVKYIYDYYALCVYRGALTMAKAGILPKEIFKIDFNLGRELANAAIAVEDAKFGLLEDKSRNGNDMCESNAFINLINRAEEQILTSFYLD
ncbi:MAG: helix-turn-helix transcriptional regulator [Eubacterium sp.]|nr:helix-turn-helix transcriptional regulator [Eubacterium sp.]